jgi:hypothetical protein
MRDYVVLQKNREQDNRLPPSHTLILDFTMTHTCYGWSIQDTTGHLTHTRRSDGPPELDGALQKVVRDKIRHYRQIYLDKPDPFTFIPVPVDTSDRVYDDFNVYFSYTLIGKYLLWSMNNRRNRINFVFFVLFVYLILRGRLG